MRRTCYTGFARRLAALLAVQPAAVAAAQTGSAAQPDAMPAPSAPAARVLTLQQALQTARAHAPELAQARAATRAARARVDIAAAPLLPQVTGTASYARGTANGPLPSQSRTSLATRDAFAAGVHATQLITDFGQSRSAKAYAEASARAQAHDERAQQLDIEYGVRSAFLTAGANRALLGVAEATLHNQQRHLEQIQGFVEVGTRPPIDLAQVRTDVANAQLDLLRANNAYTASKAELRRAMGVAAHSGDFDVDDELPAADPEEDRSIESLIAEAEDTRPEVAALRAQLAAEVEARRGIKGQYGPTLNAVGSVDEQGYQLSRLATNLSVGLSLNWPIFQGGVTNARVAEENAVIAQVQAQLDALHEDLRLALTQAQLQIKTARAALKVAAGLVNLARERLVLAEGRYTTGVGNTIELGDAELALRDAQTQRVTAQYDLAQARVLLQRSLGRP